MEKADDDGMVENMFGESPLGLSRSKRQTTDGELNGGGNRNSGTNNIVTIDKVKKKLVVDDEILFERRGVSSGVPFAPTSEEGMLVEEDLYADLYVSDHGSGKGNDGSGILRLKVSKLMSDVAAKDAVISEAEKVIQGLRETVSRLEGENETLKYNISSLFNTARLEIERKDREIEENRSEIHRLKKSVGRS